MMSNGMYSFCRAGGWFFLLSSLAFLAVTVFGQGVQPAESEDSLILFSAVWWGACALVFAWGLWFTRRTNSYIFYPRRVAEKLVELSEGGTKNACVTGGINFRRAAAWYKEEVCRSIIWLGYDPGNVVVGNDGIFLLTTEAARTGNIFPSEENRATFLMDAV